MKKRAGAREKRRVGRIGDLDRLICLQISVLWSMCGKNKTLWDVFVTWG